MSSHRVERALRQALQAPASSCAEPQLLDDVTLAEYIEDCLDAPQREAVEAHLARCAMCRQLVTEARLASSSYDEVPTPISSPNPPASAGSHTWKLPLAAAAILLAAITVGSQWMSRSGLPNDSRRSDSRPRIGALDPTFADSSLEERLTSLGVDPDVYVAVSPNVRERVEAALRGSLVTPDDFLELRSGSENATERSQPSRHSATPAPVTPRWSATRGPRPTMTWYVGHSRLAESMTGELLIIDEQDQLVATVPFERSMDGGLMSLPWPEELESLQPSSRYAWKVSVEVAGRVRSSEFVVFRVLDDEDVTSYLAPFSSNDFLAGVEMVSIGLYDEALERFANLPDTTPPAMRRQLIRGVLEQKHFDALTLELELARWLAATPRSES